MEAKEFILNWLKEIDNKIKTHIDFSSKGMISPFTDEQIRDLYCIKIILSKLIKETI